MAATKTKVEQLDYLSEKLAESKNVVFSSYRGLSVADMASLRGMLRESGLGYKVIKNNLFIKAWEKAGEGQNEELSALMAGQIGVTFGGEDLPNAAKILKEYSKKNDKLEIKGGVFEGEILDVAGINSIAGLPSKSELLATIARGINEPATQIARGMNEVMASLARAIKAVGEKNG